ncbi:hypothetical protein os1_32950 [Comamonadaceae bacterium OS-1]|nr:hypothetical protein os1_32950 [Comamonadaceae bacterium OS-1]
MPPETIRALASEIVNQTILGNWLFYVITACITVVLSAAGAFLSSYFSKRAEHVALAADFEAVKKQLRETTALSESIKVDIKHIAERSEKLQWLKREKLEDYVVAVLRGVEYLSLDMFHRLFDAETPIGEDPLLSASMLQRLYLPELDGEHAAFMRALGEFRGWIAAGMQERLDLWKATNVKGAPSQAHMEQYTERLNRVHAAVLVVELASKNLAHALNKG